MRTVSSRLPPHLSVLLTSNLLSAFPVWASRWLRLWTGLPEPTALRIRLYFSPFTIRGQACKIKENIVLATRNIFRERNARMNLLNHVYLNFNPENVIHLSEFRADKKSAATVWSGMSTEMKLWDAEPGCAQTCVSGQTGIWHVSESFTNEWMILCALSQSSLLAEHISGRESLHACCPQDRKYG